MAPPANASFCRGSANHPAGRLPAMAVSTSVVQRDARSFLVPVQGAHILMFEAVRCHLVAEPDDLALTRSG